MKQKGYSHTATTEELMLNEHMMYGSSRLGTYATNEFINDTLPTEMNLPANQRFELTDHLGTVRAVVTGEKTNGEANILALTDYYPFGMDMPGRVFTGENYRFGYQGSERDRELMGGNAYTTFFRQLDPRLGRWMSPDPKVFPWESPYVSMDNSPIALIDPWGANSTDPPKSGQLNDQGTATWGKNANTGEYEWVPVGATATISSSSPKKLILSGEPNRIERSPVKIPSSPNNSIALKTLKLTSKVMEQIPYVGDVKTLTEVSDGKKYNGVYKGSKIAMDKTGIGASLDIKAGGKKVLSVDLIDAATKMIADDMAEEMDRFILESELLDLSLISDYELFVDRMNEHNDKYGPNIIVLYSNQILNTDESGYFTKEGGFVPTYEPKYINEFVNRDVYEGFVPKYVSWGLRSSYNGTKMQIMGTIKINYEGYDIVPGRYD